MLRGPRRRGARRGPERAREDRKGVRELDAGKEYGFTDLDGRQPFFLGYVRGSLEEILARGGPANDEERWWLDAWRMQLGDQPEWRELCSRAEIALRGR